MNICPWCKSSNCSFYLNVDKYTVLICNNCELKYTKLLLAYKIAKFNSIYYEKNYLLNYLANKSVQRRLLKNLKYLEKFINGGKLLDAGCGSGTFLITVQHSSRYKWELFGFDINKYLITEASRNIEAKIETASFKSVKYPGKFFNCITCLDTLEHDVDIKENLINLRRMLADDGVLVIQVPNHRSIMAFLCGSSWDWWSPPDHVIHFSGETLKKILTKVGFEVINIKTYEPLEDFLSNIKGVFFQRKILKYFYYLVLPALIIIHWIADVSGYGALALLVAKRRP